MDWNCRTVQNWRKNGLKDHRKGSPRHVEHRLTIEEEDQFFSVANSKRFSDKTPEQIVATLATEGTYIGSPSTLYRILRRREALAHRSESKKPREAIKPQYIPVTAPNQMWAWDITWLKTEVIGIFYYGYNIIDLYDRSLVGWTIENSESEEHAKALFQRAIRDVGISPQMVHADNGNPMRGVTLAVFLDKLQVTRSYSRPRCSNDNAYIETWHKTLKYTVGYPRQFQSLELARTWYADFVNWYNTKHLHSGIGYVTPQQMRSGEALSIYEKRNNTMEVARSKNPLRWRMSKNMVYKPLPVEALFRPLNKVA